MALTCPDPPNMAAIAKQLHQTALEAEQEIFLLEQRMRSGVNPPSVVVTTTAPVAGLSANADHDIGALATFATTFDNTDGLGGGGSGTFGPQTFGTFTRNLGEGVYEVGFALTATASGVVDDNTLRLFEIRQMRPDPTVVLGESLVQRTGFTNFETNTGVGTDVAFAGVFRARPSDRWMFILRHQNTSSTLTVATGAIIWAAKVSESTLTRVL